MTAQEGDTGISASDTLTEFASGKWDGFLAQARDASMSAFWPWVLAAAEEKRALAAAQEAEAAKRTAEDAAREEEQLRQEALQLEAEGSGNAEQLRGRQQENNRKLVLAARNLHGVNLRAYATSLKHFLNEKMPKAMNLWQGQAARDAE